MNKLEASLQDGSALFIEGEPGEGDSVDIHQEDRTISGELGADRRQMVMLALPSLRGLLEACCAGRDWREGDTRAFYMGDGTMVVDQLCPAVQEASRSAATMHQRVVVTGADLEVSLALAA